MAVIAQHAGERRRPGRLRALFLAAVVSIGSIAGCFGRIWYQQQALRVGEISRALEAENQRLARHCSALQAKVARLHTPACLETYACYHTAEPANGRILRISAAELHSSIHRSASLAAQEGRGKEGTPSL
ncbi:MAG: hypothetical protein LBB14_00985 [Puniceicoccales bacterium]|jgi:cell division protein FtsB|nr:hypothetical protein [Puniceicoccales bacterium]